MKRKLFYLLVMIPLLPLTILGQGKKSHPLQDKMPSDDIYMTWNKNTPEQEMKDDVKALADHGVIITYSNVKRNDKGEITGIRLEYSDANGNKGAMECDNKKPINTIRFFKQGDELGFGEPAGADFMMGNSFGNDNFMKQFQFNDDNGGLPGQSFSYQFPNGNAFGQSSSKIIIKKDGKKPLVLENGNVIEGGDDYSAEELEEIKKNNKVESFSGDDMPGFNFNQNGSFGDLAEQMRKMQEQMNQLMAREPMAPMAPLAPKAPKAKSKRNSPPIDDTTKEELEQAKKEMQDAKKEMEEAKKELEKARSSIKMQKA
ncbi:hypothetical protein [Flavobacterium sp. XGLA_31]|uniref:hypothetical protein n=1 Tax=Flavobacterium sp. XGLA_31 TaxID=3447666 RepID=UPI003F30500E